MQILTLLILPLLCQQNADAPQQRKRITAPPVQQKPVDFNHPPRNYVTLQMHGWSVLVEKQLSDESPKLAEQTLRRLRNELSQIAGVLPVAALPKLRQLKIFVLYGDDATGGGRDNGLEYYRSDAPRHHQWLDPRMGSSIVIFDAANYRNLSDLWATKSLVHEFGHAQHLEHFPEDHAEIYDTWKSAMDKGLYNVVRDEDQQKHMPNYAAQNHLEYFAELTAFYFVGGNYFPYNRARLKTHDPRGYKLVEKIWNIKPSVDRADE